MTFMAPNDVPPRQKVPEDNAKMYSSFKQITSRSSDLFLPFSPLHLKQKTWLFSIVHECAIRMVVNCDSALIQCAAVTTAKTR